MERTRGKSIPARGYKGSKGPLCEEQKCQRGQNTEDEGEVQEMWPPTQAEGDRSVTANKQGRESGYHSQYDGEPTETEGRGATFSLRAYCRKPVTFSRI